MHEFTQIYVINGCTSFKLIFMNAITLVGWFIYWRSALEQMRRRAGSEQTQVEAITIDTVTLSPICVGMPSTYFKYYGCLRSNLEW